MMIHMPLRKKQQTALDSFIFLPLQIRSASCSLQSARRRQIHECDAIEQSWQTLKAQLHTLLIHIARRQKCLSPRCRRKKILRRDDKAERAGKNEQKIIGLIICLMQFHSAVVIEYDCCRMQWIHFCGTFVVFILLSDSKTDANSIIRAIILTAIFAIFPPHAPYHSAIWIKFYFDLHHFIFCLAVRCSLFIANRLIPFRIKWSLVEYLPRNWSRSIDFSLYLHLMSQLFIRSFCV